MPRPAPYQLRWSSARQRYELCESRNQAVIDLEVGSPAWFIWVDQVSSFAFHGRIGSYTARQERKERGGGYWYAYLRDKGKLTKRYLGRSADLTLTRLEQIAQLLGEHPADAPSHEEWTGIRQGMASFLSTPTAGAVSSRAEITAERLVATRAAAGNESTETRAWRRRLLTFRVNWRWYLLALLLPAFIWLAGIALSTFFGGHFPFHPLLLVVFPLLLLPNAGEEIGWRGFALPRLLTRFNSVTASLILGGMWGLFHLPLYSHALFTFLPFLCLVVAFSILMTCVFNHTGSVPLMVFMHASLDTIQFVSPVNETVSPFIAFALIALVMWLIAVFIMLRAGLDLGRSTKEPFYTLRSKIGIYTDRQHPFSAVYSDKDDSHSSSPTSS